MYLYKTGKHIWSTHIFAIKCISLKFLKYFMTCSVSAYGYDTKSIIHYTFFCIVNIIVKESIFTQIIYCLLNLNKIDYLSITIREKKRFDIVPKTQKARLIIIHIHVNKDLVWRHIVEQHYLHFLYKSQNTFSSVR